MIKAHFVGLYKKARESLTKQSEFEYSTALNGEGEVRAIKDSDEVIIYKKCERETKRLTISDNQRQY